MPLLLGGLRLVRLALLVDTDRSVRDFSSGQEYAPPNIEIGGAKWPGFGFHTTTCPIVCLQRTSRIDIDNVACDLTIFKPNKISQPSSFFDLFNCQKPVSTMEHMVLILTKLIRIEG